MAISSRVTKQISSPVTKRNPRPRKYASQADRQAAYRARNVMLEFRAEPKTADNITKIADTLGYPRSDVLLSMVKFALTNHDWARFGLTHKTIPTYKENPTMKPASPAQLAARKRFAEMARSGAFKKATKRKANPTSGSNAGEFAMTVNGKTVHRFFIHTSDPWAKSHGFDYQLVSNVTKHGAFVKFTKTRAIVAVDEAADGTPVTEKWEIRNLVFYKTNPAKKTVSQKISQLVHEGYPQRQAVAVALSEQRAGKVKRNPMLPMRKIQIATNNEIVIDYKYTGYGVTQKKDKTFVYNMKTGNEIFLPKQRYVLSTENGQNQFLVDFEEAVALSEQRAGKVKRNPSGLYAMKTQYLVSCPATKKNMGFFDKQSDAKIYAQELADKHGMQYAISTVKVPKIQAVHFVVGESTKSFKV